MVARDVMIMSTLALTALVNGSSSMRRRSDNDTSSVTGPRSVFWARVAAPSPGKCFPVVTTPSVCCAVMDAAPHSPQTTKSMLYERPN